MIYLTSTFIVIGSLLLALIIFATMFIVISTFVFSDRDCIESVLKIKKKYGIIWNPFDACFLFYRERYPSLFTYKMWSVIGITDLMMYSGAVLLGQFVFSENSKPSLYHRFINKMNHYLKQKYNNGI